MSASGLSLEVGDVLQLQFLGEDGDARYYVKVIGYLQDKSLLVTAPIVGGKLLFVKEGQRLAVRLLSGNSVVGFAASVLRNCARPYPYLHLSYPHDMQAIMVRKAQRVSLKVDGVVRRCLDDSTDADPQSQAVAVKVEDMSTSGALLVSPTFLAEKGDLVSVKMQVDVAGATEDLVLAAIIRNIREQELEDGGTQLLHGVEFKFTDRSESILLHAFVYEYLARHG